MEGFEGLSTLGDRVQRVFDVLVALLKNARRTGR